MSDALRGLKEVSCVVRGELDRIPWPDGDGPSCPGEPCAGGEAIAWSRYAGKETEMAAMFGKILVAVDRAILVMEHAEQTGTPEGVEP